MPPMKYSLFALSLILPGRLVAAEHVCASPRDVTAAAAKAQPGDVIRLVDGTYRSAELVLDASGTAERPIVLCAATPGKVVLTGTSCLRIGGSYLIVAGLYFWKAFHPEGLIIFRKGVAHEAHHCRVTQCAALDCNPRGEEPAGPWIVMFGAHNRFDHCALQGKAYAGSVLDVWVRGNSTAPVAHLIDHNYFGARPQLKSHTNGEILYVGHGALPSAASQIVVEANLFDRCAGGVDCVTNCASETIYRQNTFLGSAGSLTLRKCRRCRVTDNYFIGGNIAHSGGVRISGEEQTVAGNFFVHLTGTGDMAALSIMDGYTTPKPSGYSATQRCTIAENIVVRCTSPMAIGVPDRQATRKSGDRVPPWENALSSNVVVGSRKIVDMQNASALLNWRGNFYDAGELGIRWPANPPIAADAWRQVPISVGRRFGLDWPAPAPAFGPQVAPLGYAEVGTAWLPISP
jgi:poly(beta-D-mannuronate) lyase